MRRSVPCAALLAVTLCISGPGCISAEERAAGEAIVVFHSADEIPDEYVAIDRVHATVRFDSLRPDPERVIDKLQYRAYKAGADAIGNVEIRSSSRNRYAQTPRYIDMEGTAETYKKRSAAESP